MTWIALLALFAAAQAQLQSVSLPFVDLLRSHPPTQTPSLELNLKFSRTIPTTCTFPSGVTRPEVGPYTLSTTSYPVTFILTPALYQFSGLVDALSRDALEATGVQRITCEVIVSDPVHELDHTRDILAVMREISFEHASSESPLYGMVGLTCHSVCNSLHVDLGETRSFHRCQR